MFHFSFLFVKDVKHQTTENAAELKFFKNLHSLKMLAFWCLEVRLSGGALA